MLQPPVVEQFCSSFDLVGVPVWVSGAVDDVQYVNGALLAFAGRPREALLGAGLLGIVHPGDRALLAPSERRDGAAHLRLRRADGAWRWFRLETRVLVGAPALLVTTCADAHAEHHAARALAQNATSEHSTPDLPTRERPPSVIARAEGGDLAGQLLETQMTARDVSARVVAEAALADERARLWALVSSLDEGVIAIAPNGQATIINDAALRLHGYASLRDLPSTRMQDFVGVFEFAHLDGRPLAPEEWPIARALRGETLRDVELHFSRADGSCAHTISYNGRLVRGADGEPLMALITLRDITERLNTEQELRDREAQLRALADNLPHVVTYQLAVDAQGGRRFLHVSANVERINGVTPEAVLRDARELYGQVLEDDRAHLEQAERQALATGAPFNIEARFRLPNGGVRWFQLASAPRRLPSGEQVWDGVEVDVTERKEAELALRQLNVTLEERVEERTARLQELHAELTAFATSVGRDIKEPLRRVQGFATLLEKRLGGALDERANGYLRFIQAEASRVGLLVDDLGQFVRFGREDLRLGRVPLDQLVVQVRSDLETFTRGRAIEWVIPALPVVRGDMMLLRQALAALLHNALKFTRGRSVARIELGASEHDGRVTVWVRDNGVGFDPSQGERLFKVFQRLHDEHYGGAGVGLANVRRIVARHGGQVWAEGREGEGATFGFALPKS